MALVINNSNYQKMRNEDVKYLITLSPGKY